MDYGMYISASGALTSMYRQDVITNNLANASTPGFKPSLAIARQRDPVRAEDGLGHLPSNAMLERLGAGVMMSPTRLSLVQGPIEQTGNDLDIAIRGEGFFVLRHESGQDGDTLRLTRDGRLARGADGLLVRATDGKAVLDEHQREIRLPERGSIQIDARGQIRVDGVPIARLALVRVEDPRGLQPAGEGMYAPDARTMTGGLERASGTIVQGAIEGSGVNPISAMMEMTAASRAFATNIGMIAQQDRLIERAINGLGRIA